MRIILNPPILAVIYILDFNGDFPDFTKDFKISTDFAKQHTSMSTILPEATLGPLVALMGC